MSAIFFRSEVVGYASGTGANPYTVENPHIEAINLDQVIRIFPASIKEYPNCTGLMMTNNTTLFISYTFDEITTKLEGLRRDAFGAKFNPLSYDLREGM